MYVCVCMCVCVCQQVELLVFAILKTILLCANKLKIKSSTNNSLINLIYILGIEK